MKKKHLLALALLALLLLPSPALANSMEPPFLTVLVSQPPDDLSMTLQFSDGSQSKPILLEKSSKGWEAYYRFFNSSLLDDFYESVKKDAVLTVSYGGGDSFQLSLSPDDFGYNSLVTLDLDTRNLTSGQPIWRIPLLVAIRVVSTLLIEGLVFFLFRYRERRSWLVFLSVNLITQTALNLSITGPLYTGWMISYVFGEVIVFIVEAFGFTLLLREFKKGRAALCAVAANAASLILGGVLLTYLPI